LVENRNCVEKGIYHEKESNQNSLACNRFFSNGDWNDRSGTSGTSDNPISFMASFCLAKGSERFHKWFTGTKLYQKHLDSFVKNRAMTLKTKFCILLPASAMLILAMIAMSNLYGRIFIVFLIIFKYVYFFTKIETVRDTTLVGE